MTIMVLNCHSVEAGSSYPCEANHIYLKNHNVTFRLVRCKFRNVCPTQIRT